MGSLLVFSKAEMSAPTTNGSIRTRDDIRQRQKFRCHSNQRIKRQIWRVAPDGFSTANA